MEREVLDTKYVILELINGILMFTYKSEFELTLGIAQEIVKTRLEFTRGKMYPVLIKDDGLKGVTKEARDFLSSQEGVKGVKAGALLSSSFFNAFLGNFFLKITFKKPSIPARLFTDREVAIKWLEQFKEKDL